MAGKRPSTLLQLHIAGVLLCATTAFAQGSDIARHSIIEKEHYMQPSLKHYFSGLQRVFTTPANLSFLGIWSAAGVFVRPFAGCVCRRGFPVRPFDNHVSQELQQGNKTNFEADLPSRLGGSIVVAGASVLTFAAGRIVRSPEISNTGLYLMEAVFTTKLITLGLKRAVGRQRPNGQNKRSFPSGHTSGMFTIASVLHERHGAKIGIPAYLAASFVGISRVRLQNHFPTDVVAGAALGIIIGRSFASGHAESKLVELSPVVGPSYSGLLLHLNF